MLQKSQLTEAMAIAEELISKCYDYITAVTIKQGYLIPVKTLYGDGSRFENNFKVFETVYNNIKAALNTPLSANNVGNKCIYNYEYYNGKTFETKKQDAIINSLLIDVVLGAYGYEIAYDNKTVRVIDRSLPFTKNYIGEDINCLTLKN